MENNEWDDSLKELLGDHKPEGAQPDWDSFSGYLHQHQYLEELGEDADFDESLREPLSTFKASGEALGWERIESTLESDPVFDESVRNRINQFEPQYDPRTWPLLLSRLSGLGYLRTKLIAFKVVEVAAVLLLLFTVLKMGQMGKLPFDIPLYDNKNDDAHQQKSSPGDRAYIIPEELTTSENNPVIASSEKSNSASVITGSSVQSASAVLQSSSSSGSPAVSQSSASTKTLIAQQEDSSYSGNDKNEHAEINVASNNNSGISGNEIISDASRINGNVVNTIPSEISPVATEKDRAAIREIEIITASSSDFINNVSDYSYGNPVALNHDISAANFLSTFPSPVEWNQNFFLPKPKFVKQRSRTYTEFGIASQVDYNRMRMPEDRLYSAGREIVFPQQGIPSTSLGSGFTMGIGHPRWAIESGIIYSAKNFKPGRQLIVGGAFDNGSVEFEAMRLQLVSLPLQFRYRIDHKGLFKFYSLAGFSLHVIAQSDIDVLIKYHFPSLSFGENPNNDPSLAETIRETRRISEYIRDGAPFSTKSFFSVNAGLGCEYALSGHKTLFLQSSVQYQIPNLKFSNNNGKHIRTVSVQAGVRTPLGK